MAAGAKCFLRFRACDYQDILTGDVYNRLKTAGFSGTCWHIEIKYAGTFSNGLTEISAPNAVFDGTTTPIVVYAISSSASDTNAGGAGHAEKVTVLGIDENDTFNSDTINLNGTTQVASTVKFKRIFHAFVSEWGSGGDDAAGNITITNTGQAATYLTIAAGANESDGSAFWIPASYGVVMEETYLVMTSSANANAAILVQPSAVGVGNGADPDFDYQPFRATISNSGMKEHIHEILYGLGADVSKVTFSETYKGAAEDGFVSIHGYIFGTTAALRNLGGS